MIRFLISTGLHLLGNAIGLIVAALFLDDMSLDGVAFVIALLIFTAVEVLAQPLIRKFAVKHAEPMLGGVALVTTFVGLVITDVFSDGLQIEGAWTWVLATIIVWLVAMVAAIILPAIFLKNAVENRRD
jgi:putative membrane protein